MRALLTTPTPISKQTSNDPLADSLRSYRVHKRDLPTLEVLLDLAPIDPTSINDFDWPEKTIALMKQFPGADPNYHRREAAKFQSPDPGSTLDAWVAALIYSVRSHWGRDIHAGDPWAKHPRLPFPEYLQNYLEKEIWFWDWGGMADAAQLLRLACGLPRFPEKFVKEG